MNNYEEMHKLQHHLVQSFHARCYAVYLAAEVSKGKKTAGVDKMKNLSASQKLKLAQSLRLSKRPDPVRRVNIPKPGSTETRPLGIPTMADRAIQQLIKLALESEWEARFSKSMYGFRKGRRCHDALDSIRRNIQRTPKWVLDADIEKFFDRLNHEAILKKLNTFPSMSKAIHRILKAGLMEGEVFDPTELGAPQGGPLSPLLANIALCGMEQDLIKAFPANRVIAGQRINKAPRLIIYADDFICLHESKATVKEASRFITEWLKPLGLNLSPTKTRMAHSLEVVGGLRGFEFLGCYIWQKTVGKHQLSPHFKGIYTHIAPSKKSQKKIYAECSRAIDKVVYSKKRNAQYAHKVAKGGPTAQERLIKQLNPKLRGWAEYHRYHNSKRVFSTLDHKLFIKLWRWVKRRQRKWSRKRLIDEYFDGANPWRFKSPREGLEKEIALMRVDSVSIKSHILIKSEKSFFDGDWAYWGKRRGKYPGIPRCVTNCLKRQTGNCWHCHEGIESTHRVMTQRIPTDKGHAKQRLVHEACSNRNRRYPTRDAFIR